MEENLMEQMIYENDQHEASLLDTMKSMYDNGQLVDIKLQVQEDSYCCHKNVLAATSPYFRAMFTSELRESKRDSISLYEVDSESVRLIIDYAYSGQVIIHRTNAQNLLAAASLFQITAVQEACAKFMETQLDASNCVGIHFFANIHNCKELCDKARECMEKNFTDVFPGEEFMALSADKIGEIISSNELNVENEEVVFDALMKWIQFDKNERLNFLSELLPHIRFALLHSKYIQENIMCNEMVLACDKCQRLLQDLKDFEASPESYHGNHVFNVILRSGMIKPEYCILLIGGVDHTRPSINCYNPLTRESYYLADISCNSDSKTNIGYYDIEDPACVVTEDNQIFVAGGNYIYHENYMETLSDDSFDDYEDETVRKDFYQYDNDHDSWTSKASMLFPKSNFALANYEGSIYCFGGLTINQHPTEIVERYDIALNRWNYVGMMPTTLVDLSTVVHNELIYILGGRTGVGAHNVVMSYNPKISDWTSLAGMPTPRFKFGTCVLDDEIYVAGGQIYSHSSHTINREALNSVEIYSIAQNQWRQGPELPEDTYNVGLFVMNGSLYACGTTEFQRSAYRIYRYNVVYKLNVASSQWEQIESDLCDVRDFACVAAKMQTRKLSQVFRPEVDT